MWGKVHKLFLVAYPDRNALSPEFVATLESRLGSHPNDAIEAAAAVLVESEPHPPSISAWVDALEGKRQRVPIPQLDVYARKIVASSGLPVTKGWKAERGEPAAYIELRRRQGLPATAPTKALTYSPPPDLDRPEHDGEPRPILPQELLDRAVPARGHETWRRDEGCYACGYRRNRPGATVCEYCRRSLPGPAQPKDQR